jgi:hypothetical protein
MKAISKLKSGKAVGLDSLPNEILKSGGSILVPILQKLLVHKMWGYFPCF